MTEKERNSKLNKMKIISIVCLVVVILMNMFSWVSFGVDPYGGRYIKDSINSVIDQYADDDVQDMLQDQFDDADIDLDIKDFVADADALFNPLMDLGISPLDLVSMSIGISGMLDFMTSPEMEEYMGYSMIEDQDTVMGMNVIRIVLLIGAGLAIITCALAILHIVFHIINRKGLGISVPIFTFINMIYMAFIWLLAMALVTDMGSIAVPTLAPFVALVCAILSCVFWGRARKYINMVEVQVPVQQPYAQPVPSVQPQAQVQPAKKFCRTCGTELGEGAKFCPKCGGAQ